MAEKSTMSEQIVSDGGVALEKKKKKQEHEDQEQSHRVVVGDNGGKKKEEQEGEESHRMVVGDNGGKKKQEEAPQQNTTRPLRAVAAAIPYKIRVMKEIMTYICLVHFGITYNMVLRAIFENRGISGYVYLSMAFFFISTNSADLSLQFSHRRITALVISATTWILGWGFLAAVFDYDDLALHFIGSIIELLPLILLALYSPN